MRLTILAALVLISAPAMACEGFKNSMDALERAIGIERGTNSEPKLVTAKQSAEKLLREELKRNPQTSKVTPKKIKAPLEKAPSYN